jgi:Arc/MetJ-type ribon-helix-helix transcriptional regulator
MPRPEEFPIKLQLSLSEELDRAIKHWRSRQDDVPNRSEAIRRLLARQLASEMETIKRIRPLAPAPHRAKRKSA